jgi:hypothetical protein
VATTRQLVIRGHTVLYTVLCAVCRLCVFLATTHSTFNIDTYMYTSE